MEEAVHGGAADHRRPEGGPGRGADEGPCGDTGLLERASTLEAKYGGME